MFNFLNSTILFAAAAALIPLLIHLFSKRKVKIIEFSSVRHLKAMQKKQVRRLKIKQLLLLLLRMLFILCVVLAFARPTTESGSLGSHASVSAVILFDNSASMNRFVSDGNLYDLAKKRTGDLINGFTEGDELYLLPLTASGSQSAASGGSPAYALELLESIACSEESADLPGRYQNALDILSNTQHVNKELYLITDRQRNNLSDELPEIPEEVQVYIVDLPLDPVENYGITSVDFGGQMILPGHDFNLSAMIQNYSSDASDDLIASLYLDGNRVAQTSVAVPSGGESAVTFTRSVSRTGSHVGYVELSDDKFLGDNRFYFSFTIPEQFNVLVIDGDNTGELIKLALSPSTEINQYWSVKTTTPEQLSGVRFWEYDVILLTGAPVLTDSYMQRLRSYLQRGKALMMTYSPFTDTVNFNQQYAELSGVVIDESARKQVARAGYFSFKSYDNSHPIFSIFSFKDNQLPEIKFYTLPKTHLLETATNLLTFTGERPGLVENSYQGGRVLTFTAPLLPQYTEFPATAFFVPFISRTVEYLAADLSEYNTSSYCGQSVTRTINEDIDMRLPLMLTYPDGSTMSIVPQEKQGQLTATVDNLTQTGLYSLSVAGHTLDRFAVNLPLLEGDLDPLDTDNFASTVPTEDPNILSSGTDIATVLAEFRFGRELWTLFLWIAVACLILEMLLSRATATEE